MMITKRTLTYLGCIYAIFSSFSVVVASDSYTILEPPKAPKKINTLSKKDLEKLDLFLQLKPEQFSDWAYSAQKTENDVRIELLQKLIEKGLSKKERNILKNNKEEYIFKKNKKEQPSLKKNKWSFFRKKPIPIGRMALNCYTEKEKIEKKFKKKKKKNNVLVLDRKKRNYLQAYYYTDCQVIFDLAIKNLRDRKQIWVLKKCLEYHDYKEKTIFYQALEDKNIQVIYRILKLSFSKNGKKMVNHFLNHHPSKKAHPIQLFLQIEDEAFEDFKRITKTSLEDLRKEALERFVENGLDKDGKHILSQNKKWNYILSPDKKLKKQENKSKIPQIKESKEPHLPLNQAGKPHIDLQESQNNGENLVSNQDEKEGAAENDSINEGLSSDTGVQDPQNSGENLGSTDNEDLTPISKNAKENDSINEDLSSDTDVQDPQNNVQNLGSTDNEDLSLIPNQDQKENETEDDLIIEDTGITSDIKERKGLLTPPNKIYSSDTAAQKLQSNEQNLDQPSKKNGAYLTVFIVGIPTVVIVTLLLGKKKVKQKLSKTKRKHTHKNS